MTYLCSSRVAAKAMSWGLGTIVCIPHVSESLPSSAHIHRQTRVTECILVCSSIEPGLSVLDFSL